MPKRSNWERNIKSKLDEWKEPVPDFLWDEIEKDIPKENVFRRNIALIRNIAAILAVSVIGIAVYFISVNRPATDENIAAIIESEKTDGPAIQNHDGSQYITVKVEPEKILLAKNTEKTQKGKIYNNAADRRQMSAEETENLLSGKNDVNIKNEEDKREETSAMEYSPLKKSNSRNTDRYTRQNKYSRKLNTRKSDSKWSVSVQAGNTYSNSGISQTGFSAREASMLLETNQISTYQSVFMKASVEQPETYVKHHFPITGAITVRRYINDRFSFETGLQYTMLRTDITSGGNTKLVKKQKLQYLGAPVKFNYDIVQTKGFTLYASAGGAIEGCIAADNTKELFKNDEIIISENEKIEMNKIQLSANAAIGIQFNPVSFMGIFAEPGITYFFDDGNDISNIRQEHPLNFQLKGGIRFSF